MGCTLVDLKDLTQKIHGLISHHFSGISEKAIQENIKGERKAQSVRPQFVNKSPLTPVISSGVKECNQLDLVDFSDMPIEVDNDGLIYKYVVCLGHL